MSILECKVSLPELKDFIKDLVLVPENIFKLIKRDIRDPIGVLVQREIEFDEMWHFIQSKKTMDYQGIGS